MAVFYRLSQVTSPKQKGYGKWYPRAVMTNTVDTDALATIMQRNCTVKKSVSPCGDDQHRGYRCTRHDHAT